MKRTLTVAGLIACATLALGVPAASAAGGKGTSFCSFSGKPDFSIVEGDLSTYANAGELVSALAPLPGIPRAGWGIQSVCNPNNFAAG
jgi:hypothetical protein